MATFTPAQFQALPNDLIWKIKGMWRAQVQAEKRAKRELKKENRFGKMLEALETLREKTRKKWEENLATDDFWRTNNYTMEDFICPMGNLNETDPGKYESWVETGGVLFFIKNSLDAEKYNKIIKNIWETPLLVENSYFYREMDEYILKYKKPCFVYIPFGNDLEIAYSARGITELKKHYDF